MRPRGCAGHALLRHCAAETIAVDDQVAVRNSDIDAPGPRHDHENGRGEVRRPAATASRPSARRPSRAGITRASRCSSSTTTSSTRWSTPAPEPHPPDRHALDRHPASICRPEFRRPVKLARFAAPAQRRIDSRCPLCCDPPLPDTVRRRWRWRGLHGSARALALAEAAACRHAALVLHRLRHARARATRPRNCAFFGGGATRGPDAARLGNAAVRHLLAASGHRLRAPATLCARCPSFAAASCCWPPTSLLTRLPPVAYVQARSFELKRGRAAGARAAAPAAGAVRLRQRRPGARVRASSRCAARCSTSIRWARRRRCGSICSTTGSTPSAASIPNAALA